MRETVQAWLPQDEPPKAIVVVSAHWEGNPVRITSAAQPPMLYDYDGFPPEAYQYDYPAPGHPALAQTIHDLLRKAGIDSVLDPARGLDHGVFVPLLLMYPAADIPVVAVSLDSSLDATKNMALGAALESLREEGVLLLGSGYTFHNMEAFFHPSHETKRQSGFFNDWLKETLLGSDSPSDALSQLSKWEDAPGARLCHPRAEHLLPLLFIAAAAGPQAKATLIQDVPSSPEDHAISAYLFA
jgi:aromatic ring-opening dioxygenase catalytic subunit (LigB family)